MNTSVETGWLWFRYTPMQANMFFGGADGLVRVVVAGVVFSITLAAVTYAPGQHGPRLLTNFARDRGNQLALASIGVLIHFFHHVIETIHINNMIARIGRKLIDALQRHANNKERHDGDGRGIGAGHVSTLDADRPGYIESIDNYALTRLAAKHGHVVRLRCRPGGFVIAGAPLLESIGDLDGATLAPEALRKAFVIGDRRTDLQDMRFGFDEVTAIACIDWLTAALSECEKRVASTGENGDGNTRRVRTTPLTYGDFVGASFGRLRQHAATEATVKYAALQGLSRLAAGATMPQNRLRLLAERAELERIQP